MFDNPGGKLRIIAAWYFVLGLIGAVGMVIGSFFFLEDGGWILLLSAIGEFIAVWIGTVAMLALADAAEGAVTAANNTKKLLELYEKSARTEEKASAERKTPPVSVNPDGKIPAWQRVEMQEKTDEPTDDSAKDQTVAPAAVSETEIACPKCGTKQGKGRSVCWSCGQRFV